MICEAIQERLVAEEPLSEQERAHLQACPACQAFAASLGDLAQAGAGLAAFGPAPAAEVATVRERVQARLAPAPLARRLAFALPALALGAAGVVAMLSVGGWPDAARTGAAVFSLMDEVDGIAIGPDRLAVMVVPEQAGIQDAPTDGQPATSLLDEVDAITTGRDDELGLLTDWLDDRQDAAAQEAGWDLDLPAGYEFLDEVLEQRWL